MQPYVIKSTSLSYRLAHEYADFDIRFNNDICAFRRKVFRGFFNILLGLLCAFIILGSFVHFFIAIGFAIFTEYEFFGTVEMAPAMIITALVCAAFICWLWSKFMNYLKCIHANRVAKRRDKERKLPPKPPKQPSFIAITYKTLKEKYCVPIKVDHDSK